MYEIFSQISNILSQPFLNMINSTEGIPILFAFLLGIIGALAPCQFTGNLGAITVYGNQSIQKRIAWSEIMFFILGKVLIFSLLGMIVWILGSEVKSTLTVYFPWFKKIAGPILIVI
ncbi:urease accessory protein UreH domain-containing protein, partial [Bacillus sp. JJ722]|uniref:urease accessory protein UreH domain-containing protein n=1 Tax=Bacillus sp. JJ722 TaxID=3122973 RepID=UPI002FFFC6BC